MFLAQGNQEHYRAINYLTRLGAIFHLPKSPTNNVEAVHESGKSERMQRRWVPLYLTAGLEEFTCKLLLKRKEETHFALLSFHIDGLHQHHVR
jgi:hypothetical protein